MKWGSERPETDTEHTGCPRIRPCEPGFQRDSIWFKLNICRRKRRNPPAGSAGGRAI